MEKSNIQKKKSFLFGGITGAISQFVTFPLDYYKVNRQLVNSNSLSFNNKLIHGLRVSIPQSIITFPRVGIRFYSFEKYNEYLDNKLLSGLGAGMTETLLIYNVSETNNIHSLNFNGGYDQVEVVEPDGHFGGMQKLTISFDFVVNSFPAGASSGSYGSYSTLVSGGYITEGWGGPFLIQLKGATQVLRFYVNNGSWNNLSQVTYSYNNFNLYQEYNLCAVYDGNGLYLYVDGVLVATGGGNVTGALQTTNNVRIGRSYSGDGFDGMLDNVSIWDKAFDST